jgi:hypothetical protein
MHQKQPPAKVARASEVLDAVGGCGVGMVSCVCVQAMSAPVVKMMTKSNARIVSFLILD